MNQTQPITPERLSAFFRPQSIALVGATDNSLWSLYTFQNLKNLGFPGPVWCVNPNHDIIHGKPALKRLSDIPQPIDMAFIMVPTQQVYPVVKEAAALGISNLIILTAGFSEVGSAGQQLELQMLEFAQSHNIVLLGPNGNGFINFIDHIAPYGLPILTPYIQGPVSIVLQSGALVSATLIFAQTRHIGLSLLVSMGNETMISATDVIDYLIEDESTRVIALFLESIRQPDEFRRVARKALERKKPIVALKIGKSDASVRTARAHTGALVGNDAVNDAMFKQLGIVRVSSLEDLLITAGLLGYARPLPGRRMGVVTPSGGACNILSDRAEEEGIVLPEFTPETVKRLEKAVPEFTTVQNPLDVTGYILLDRTLIQRALEIVVEDPGLDFVVCIMDSPRIAPLQLEPLLQQYNGLATTVQKARVPVVFMSYTSANITPFGSSIIERTGIHFVGGMEHGMTALGKVRWWNETSRKLSVQLEPANAPSGPILQEPPSGDWSEFKARSLLQAQNIPVVPGVLATNAEEAVVAARQFGFPVVLKIQAGEITHKSDIGGVLLNVPTEDAVHSGFETMLSKCKTQFPTVEIEGVLISPMRSAGIELLVGVMRDAVWGLVLAIGLGGIWVEAFKDTSLRVLPIGRDEIKQMLQELRGVALLQGRRGQTPVNLDAVAEVIFQVTQVAQGLDEHLETLEINPLWVSEERIEALDVLVTWKS